MAAKAVRLAGPLIVATLVLASLGALVMNQRERREGLVLDRIHVTTSFSPDGDGNGDLAEISFRIKGPDLVTLDVIDSAGDSVRRVAEGVRLGNRKQRRFVWNGLGEAGETLPAGAYRLRITILGRGRTVTPSEEILVVRPQP